MSVTKRRTAKSIVVVESPAKAQTINKYLGSGFKVLASYGHVRDLLPKSTSVDPENDFAMCYVPIDKNKKHVNEIASALKSADTLYLATDPDREGEAIAWHLLELLREKKALKNKSVLRISFNQITKIAIQYAIAHPRELSSELGDAQKARQGVDFLVGWNLCLLIWRKISPGLSAGRVQSPALRLIVEREKEIETFQSQEYWTIHALLLRDDKEIKTKLIRYQGKTLKQFDLANETDAAKAVNTLIKLANGYLTVSKVESKQRKRQPYAPFITSTLQQEASRRLGFSAQKTMMIAQQLYEGIALNDGSSGLITYMRTDSINMAKEAINSIRSYIKTKFGEEQLPASPRIYKTKAKNAQEAHEAIRPTSINRHYDDIQSCLNTDQYKLYKLIWQRTAASQMEDARFKVLTVDFQAGDSNVFRTSGSTLLFTGFLQIYGDSSDTASDKDQSLPNFKENETVQLKSITPIEHHTEPPARYSEANLIKALEEYGIGRPSTYASIITTLKKRRYVDMDRKRFIPRDIGRIVNKFLTKHFTKYVDYDFTAQFENDLDDIARGDKDRVSVMESFWKPFINQIQDVGEHVTRANATQEKLDELCPECESPLVIRLSKKGQRFIGCTNYPKCTYTRPVDTTEQQQSETLERECPKCHAPLIIKHGPYGKFVGCSNYPNCHYLEKLNQPESTGISCPSCHQGELLKRRSRRRNKVFYACSAYPKCHYAIWYPPIDTPCPKCNWPILILKTTKKQGTQEVCPQKECGYTHDIDEK
jgi:DNA topoisomerase-1